MAIERRAAGSSGTRLLLILILIAASALRWWYLDFGYDENRFWDERYSIENILPIVETGHFVRVRDYYPTPLWSIPPGYLLRWLQGWSVEYDRPSLQVVDSRRLTVSGFRVVRGLQMLSGVAGIFVVFLIGRRVFDATIGLWAAAIVAFLPWHVHASAIFKPDALQTTFVLISLLFCLRTVDRQSAMDAAVAGIAIALALSSKFLGGLVALSLVLGTAMYGWRDRRRVGLLALAGVVSVVVFILLNPEWREYPAILAAHGVDYAGRAEASGHTRAQIPVKLLSLVLAWNGHGRLLGAVALVGLAVLTSRLLSRSISRESRVRLAMLLVYPLLHILVYICQTPYFKENNFLTIFPVTSLAIAWVIVTLWRRLVSRTEWSGTEWLGRAPVAVTSAVVLSASFVVPGFNYVYRSVCPSTLDGAIAHLNRSLRPSYARLVAADWIEPGLAWEGRRTIGDGLSAFRWLPNLELWDDRRLRLADAVLFRVPNWWQPRHERERYRELIEQALPGELVRLEPEFLRVRGNRGVLIDHHWQLAEPSPSLTAIAYAGATHFDVVLPSWIRRGEYATLHVYLPYTVLNAMGGPPKVTVGSFEPTLVYTKRDGAGGLLVSERFIVEEEQAAIRFHTTMNDWGYDKPRIFLMRWRDAAGGTAVAPLAPASLLVWRHDATNAITAWRVAAGSVSETLTLPRPEEDGQRVVGSGDVDGDGHSDLVWQVGATGAVTVWRLDGFTSPLGYEVVDDGGRAVVGVGDLDGDGRAELLEQEASGGGLVVRFVDGREQSELVVDRRPVEGARLAAVGDVDGDGRAELVWQRQPSGEIVVWTMNGAVVGEERPLARALDPGWDVVGALVVDGAGSLVLWSTELQQAAVWRLADGRVIDGFYLPSLGEAGWQLVAAD